MARATKLVAFVLGSAAAGWPAAVWPCDAHRDGTSTVSAVPVVIKGEAGTTIPPRRTVVLLDGVLIDVSQFVVAAPDNCLFYYHWHAANGGSVTALDGTVVPDPAPLVCGYGPVGSIRAFEVYDTALPDADFDGLPDAADGAPDNPDADGDGIPDGNEDADNDGLNTGEEFWVTRTDAAIADTDADGRSDGLQFLLSRTAHDFTVIPLIANVYTGSGATSAHVQEAIALANTVLRKARLKFVQVRISTGVTSGDDGDGGGTAEDGSFTVEEGRNVAYNGRNEAAALPGRKGFKVSFAANNGVEVGSTTPGISYHRVGSVICTQRASGALSAATIAHELFHVLTLAHPAKGSAEDTAGNIMTPSNAGRDAFVNSPDPDKGLANVTLTPAQLAQITADGIVPQLGVTGTHNSPARKREYESGIAVDAADDHTGGEPAHLDLREIQAASDERSDYVHVLLSLGGRFPDSADFLAVYRVLFDADGDAGTGSQGGVGFDIEIQATVMRADGGECHAFLRRFAPAGNRTPVIPAPEIRPVTVRADDASFVEHVESDLVELRIPKAMLGLGADQVPVRVLARAAELGSNVDVADFVYERDRWAQDPTLALARESAGSGQTVPFTLTGFAPMVDFELRVGDVVQIADTTDAKGAFNGSFVAPVIEAQPLHFVTALAADERVAISALLVQTGVFADGFEE